jgi:hypothetical protein
LLNYYHLVTMTQNTLAHCNHLKHVCNSVSQWHKVYRFLVIIFIYMCVTMTQNTLTHCYKWQLWLWSYGSWIYNYPCNQCLVPQMMGVRILIRARCTTVCDKVCQWLATGLWLSLGPPVSSTNKTDCHDISEILSNTIKQTNKQTKHCYHLTHVCHNETNYIDTFLSSYSCVSQWH